MDGLVKNVMPMTESLKALCFVLIHLSEQQGATFNITNADKGDLIIGTLKGYLRVIHLESKIQNNILVGYGSLRDVNYAQDGSLYVVTSNNEEGYAVVKRNDDRILRIMKA